MNKKTEAIAKRFIKGAIASAVSSMAMVTLSQPAVWSDFTVLINSLAMAGTFGAITGLLLALNKWASWQGELPEWIDRE